MKSRRSIFRTLKAGRCVRMRFRSGSARIFSSLRHDFFRPVFFLTEFPFLQYLKLIIDIITISAQHSGSAGICAAASGFSLSDLPFIRTIRAGLAAIKTGYWKVLLIILASAAAGLIFAALFSFVSVAILQRILQIIVFTLLGSAGTYLVYKTGLGIFTKGAGR